MSEGADDGALPAVTSCSAHGQGRPAPATKTPCSPCRPTMRRPGASPGCGCRYRLAPCPVAHLARHGSLQWLLLQLARKIGRRGRAGGTVHPRLHTAWLHTKFVGRLLLCVCSALFTKPGNSYCCRFCELCSPNYALCLSGASKRFADHVVTCAQVENPAAVALVWCPLAACVGRSLSSHSELFPRVVHLL
jgi:hypothetical protein